MTVPTTEPTAITAGDTIAWTRSLADYPASSGWTLSYALRSATGMIDITASASGADHAVSVAASVSKTWTPGTYAWAAFVTKAAERYEVARGEILVRPNLAQAAPLDDRTHARKVLDAIEAVIEGRASKDQEEYTIGDRSLKRTPIVELIRLRGVYRGEVRREQQAQAIAKGLSSGANIFVRFGRVG